ncbi:MAG: GNAT family N-acetyltransferase [Clostridiales Family XIII bacterium]|jgi:N-acetylglutamate synthase-like GNAT family acetyltransferase|nr:GNAT family N-acetyltransferase [Clostridiales Family XIII bacterium]
MPFEIKPTDEYERLVPFFIAQGLEFSEEDEVPTDIVSCYIAEYPDTTIAGAAVLALREGEYICDGIATDEAARGAGLGRALLETLLADVRARSGGKLFLVARAPGFFAKHGFTPVPRAAAPNFFECFTCPQYNVTCFPEVMRRTLIP